MYLYGYKTLRLHESRVSRFASKYGFVYRSISTHYRPCMTNRVDTINDVSLALSTPKTVVCYLYDEHGFGLWEIKQKEGENYTFSLREKWRRL